MASNIRSLLMRANRLLGANLVEANLVKLEDLEVASERLLDLVEAGKPRETTVLGLLAYQQKVLREEDVIQYAVDTDGVGLVDLRTYDVPDDVKRALDPATCWATWSVPFDREEDFHFIATAYYLSPAVRAHWEKQCDGPILWFATTLGGVADFIEKIEADRASAAAALAKPFA
jgi:hypothetical protein